MPTATGAMHDLGGDGRPLDRRLDAQPVRAVEDEPPHVTIQPPSTHSTCPVT